jgi:hypothetical protein
VFEFKTTLRVFVFINYPVYFFFCCETRFQCFQAPIFKQAVILLLEVIECERCSGNGHLLVKSKRYLCQACGGDGVVICPECREKESFS